jgi:hypothetical protein
MCINEMYLTLISAAAHWVRRIDLTEIYTARPGFWLRDQ